MKKIRPLRVTIRTMMLIGGFLLYLAAVLVTAGLSIRHLKGDYASSMIGAVRTFEEIISDRFRESEAIIGRLIAEVPGNDEAQIADRVRDRLNLLGSPDLIYSVDKRGRISSIGEPHGQYFGLDLSHIEYIANKNRVSEVHQSLFTLKPVVSLCYAFSSGGLLVQEKALRWIIPVAKQFHQNEIIRRGELFILAENGTVVYHPDPHLMESRHNLGFELKKHREPDSRGLRSFTYQGEPYIGYQEELEVPAGWRIYFIIPVRVFFHHVGRISVQLFFIFAVLLALFVGLLHFWIVRRLTVPVNRIVSFLSDRPGHGLLGPIPPAVAAGTRELSLVVEAYNGLQERLKQATEILRESEERYRLLVETITDGVFIIDVDGRFTYLNPIFSKMTGWPVEDFVGRPFTEILAPEYRDSTVEIFRRGLAGETIPPYEVDILCRDSGRLSVELNVTTMLGPDGQRIGRIGVARDVSGRKEAERALRDSEQRFRSVVEHSHEGILVVDEASHFLYVNDQLCSMLGYEREEIIGREFQDFLDEETKRLVSQRYWDRQKGLEVPSRYEFNFVRKDGVKRLVEISSTVIRDPSGRARTVAQILDITERRRVEQEKRELEAQLVQAQKLEAVGILAGGIAHDFNNLLQAVQGYTELLLLRRGEEEGHQELQEILWASRRATELTKQLLTFSRKIESRPQLVELNQQIRETAKLLERTLSKMIAIELALDGDLPLIRIDPGQLEQVLMNLALNARDAMPSGGTMKVSSKKVDLDEEFCKTHPEITPGPYILLTVIDTGQGIAPEDLERIFEPFFSTKEVGKGTGLGLAMVYGIVKNHNGYITCTSEQGKGSTFKIYLPAAEAAEIVEGGPENKMVEGGSETILLVDDEESVRTLAEKVLKIAGYRVRTADSGETALEILRRAEQEIDVVILDMIMPGMGGSRCLKEILQINPQTRVLVASGFFENGSEKGALAAGARGFLSKPYHMKEMLRTVRTVLNA